MQFLFYGGFSLSKETEEFKRSTAFLIPMIKKTAPIIFTSLLVGGILKYILATRGFENMVLIGFLMIILALKRNGAK